METWGPGRWTLITLLAIGAVLALGWGIQLTYLRFVEGPAITQHAQNVRHSLNFTQTANQRAQTAMAEYTTDSANGDTTHANADRLQACSAAHTINPDEQASDVRAFVVQNCGG
jgi:hypothetical protein